MDDFHAKLLHYFPNAPFLFSLDSTIDLDEKFTDEKVIFIKDTRIGKDHVYYQKNNGNLPYNLIMIKSVDDKPITLKYIIESMIHSSSYNDPKLIESEICFFQGLVKTTPIQYEALFSN